MKRTGILRMLTVLVVSLHAYCLPAQGTGATWLSSLEKLKKGRRQRASSSDPDWRNGNRDNRPIKPGETITVAELKGPGRITHIWFTISASDPNYGRSVTLRMYWDGSGQPAVESPLGDFFAAGHGMTVPVNSMPVQVSSEGRAYNCYWPMPFRSSAKITVTNHSKNHPVHALFWYVDWIKLPSLDKDAAYFHAQYRQEFPCKAGENYLIFEGEGEGHYVGTVLSVHTNSPGWFGEGDDFFFIDGEKTPSLRGTGTEDYFCDAWGFRKFNRPFYGVTIWEGFDTDDHGTVYRWHVTDPVPFKKSLKVTIEHKGVVFEPTEIATGKPIDIDILRGEKPEHKPEDEGVYKYVYTFPGRHVKSGFGERADYFSSVAFWYQKGKAKRFATLPPASERLVSGIRIEGENLIDAAEAVPEQGLEVQKGGGYSGNAHLFYHPKPSEEAPVLKVPFQVEEPARYVLKARLTRSWDYGVYKISLDEKPVQEPVDLYSPSIRSRVVELGTHNLKKGEHTLQFEYVRSNTQSKVRDTGEKGRYLGLDTIRMRKIPALSVKKVRIRR